MTRRSWFASLLAVLGVGNSLKWLAPATASSPASDLFPYPTYRVSGADALARWTQLRAAGGGYPLIVGPPGTAEQVAELAELNEGTVDDILTAAAAVRFPHDLLERLAVELREQASEFGETYDDGYRVGEWPSHVDPNPGPELVRDVQSGGPLPEVFIIVLPTNDAAEAIAMLRYGGWNECPPPEVHVAAFRSWRDRFGFEPVCVGHDIIEGRVTRRPADQAAALTLARELFAYCPDIVDQGTDDLATLAAILMVSDWWFFWWD
jgi:hypothetical protein